MIHQPIISKSDPRYQQAYQSLIELARSRPFGGYKVIYADNPVLFENWSHKGADRGALKHYPCMSAELLASLPVASLAADNAVLFTWACWPLIFETQPVFQAWGFKFSGLAWEWIKRNPKTGKYAFGGGYGTRKNVEPCLLCTRGKPKVQTRSERDILYAPRREHSRKPEEAYGKIQRMFPGPYLELFARTERPGWQSWGNQTDLFGEVAA